MSLTGTERSRPRRARALAAAALLCAMASLLPALFAGPSFAQSGRRTQGGRQGTSPAATPAPAPEEESESKPRARATKGTSAPVVSFAVYRMDDALSAIPFNVSDIVMDGFLRRLGQSPVVSVVQGAGRLTRGEARERAKKEKDVYTVLLHLEEESAERGIESAGQADPRTLVLRTYVYAPITAALKFQDRVYQRPYRPRASVGGIGLPLPTARAGRFPAEYQLEQAARDAADRLMSHFNVIPPPEN